MSYPAESFHTGDRVRFRQWDDMVSEFRCDSYGDIDVGDSSFVHGMAHLCGTEATIVDMDCKNSHGYSHTKVWLTDFQYRGRGGTSWYYTTEMLEPVSACGSFSSADFVSMLGGGQA